MGYSRAVDAGTLEKMADLVVDFGANVQPGQRVHIGASIGQEELARAVAARCYRAGAVFVHVAYRDPWVQRARLDDAVDEALGYEPGWIVQMIREHGEDRGATIGLSGPVAPGLLDGADPDRIRRDRPARPARGAREHDRGPAQLVGDPVPDSGLGCARPSRSRRRTPRSRGCGSRSCTSAALDEPDPVAAWGERMDQIERAKAALNELSLDAVHLARPGDRSRDRPPALVAVDGRPPDHQLRPRAPSQPARPRRSSRCPIPSASQGTVRSSKPLQLDGSVVRDFTVEFDGGRVKRIEAAANGDVLEAYASRDEGASRLGEIALVDGRGRVGPLQTVFYDTLIDENAASHMALGQGFDWAVGDDDIPRINRSQIHVDFMFGSDEVEVDGVTGGGERVPLLRGGAWQV